MDKLKPKTKLSNQRQLKQLQNIGDQTNLRANMIGKMQDDLDLDDNVDIGKDVSANANGEVDVSVDDVEVHANFSNANKNIQNPKTKNRRLKVFSIIIFSTICFVLFTSHPKAQKPADLLYPQSIEIQGQWSLSKQSIETLQKQWSSSNGLSKQSIQTLERQWNGLSRQSIQTLQKQWNPQKSSKQAQSQMNNHQKFIALRQKHSIQSHASSKIIEQAYHDPYNYDYYKQNHALRCSEFLPYAYFESPPVQYYHWYGKVGKQVSGRRYENGHVYERHLAVGEKCTAQQRKQKKTVFLNMNEFNKAFNQVGFPCNLHDHTQFQFQAHGTFNFNVKGIDCANGNKYDFKQYFALYKRGIQDPYPSQNDYMRSMFVIMWTFYPKR